ncbi:hypothetical protein Pcinc_008478 [Petrolisthes cinctipes]|uniref:Uncharacterized protein n=1 Tax=Petrolisthes cinctipes TaxID=88211 RepID=A0AAE1KVT5_PETCI|nr:hypothetical protein Pcinc_008478 [Petrolisthes cinctipes]
MEDSDTKCDNRRPNGRICDVTRQPVTSAALMIFPADPSHSLHNTLWSTYKLHSRPNNMDGYIFADHNRFQSSFHHLPQFSDSTKLINMN